MLRSPLACCYNPRMGDVERFYIESIKKRFIEAISGLDVPSDQMEEAKKHFLESIEEALGSGRAMEITRNDLVKFIDHLLCRQGTHLSDFDRLHQKKAELDRKLFGDDAP